MFYFQRTKRLKTIDIHLLKKTNFLLHLEILSSVSPPGVPRLNLPRGLGGGTHLVVDENGSLKLKCKAAKEGNPDAFIVWEKNGRVIEPGIRVRLRTKR